jgi:cellulose biosynthesis protein BcsQ
MSLANPVIAIASRKGGVGKTTVATSIALSVAAAQSTPPVFLDCDVETPNAHLFLPPVLEQGSTKRGKHFGRVVLNIGEPMAVPIIRRLKE